MQKKHIITIAGKLGSGKSSTAKSLAQYFGYQHFSSGDLFREIAAKQGEDVLQANKSAENDSTIDHLVDQRLRDIGENEDNKVIDSRTAWHWIPQSFKVYLTLDTKVAAERIINSMNERKLANERIHDDVDAYAAALDERFNSENKRYMDIYNIDPAQSSNYDLVVDTAQYSLDEVIELIKRTYTKWLES